MDLAVYQQWVRDTSMYPPGLGYPLEQLCSEAGEALGIMLKMKRVLHRHDVMASDLKPTHHMALTKELSDVLWSLTAAMNELGITLEELATYNFQKLEERRANGTLYNQHAISSDALAALSTGRFEGAVENEAAKPRREPAVCPECNGLGGYPICGACQNTAAQPV